MDNQENLKIIPAQVVELDTSKERLLRIEAVATDMQIKFRRKEIETLFLLLAKYLYTMREKKLWKVLGYHSMNSYLADPDVGIDRSDYYLLVGIYEDFVLKLSVQSDNLNQVGKTKLGIIRPYVNEHEDQVDELLNDAMALSKTDLRKQLRDRFADMEVMQPVVHATWEYIAEKLYQDLKNLVSDVKLPSMQLFEEAKKGRFYE